MLSLHQIREAMCGKCAPGKTLLIVKPADKRAIFLLLFAQVTRCVVNLEFFFSRPRNCKDLSDYGKSITPPKPLLASKEFSSYAKTIFDR